MSTESRLTEAAESGEIAKIRYHGGSQAGTFREISPISVKGSKVRARCYASDAIKTFSIERVEIVSFSNKGDHWEQGKVELTKYENLSQLLSEKTDFFP